MESSTSTLKMSQLRLLVAAAEDGSLTAAARRLGISQPAASIRLSELEEDLGATLVDRSVRGVQLTAAGVLALRNARAALAAEAALRREVHDLVGLRRGQLQALRSIQRTQPAAILCRLRRTLSRKLNRATPST